MFDGRAQRQEYWYFILFHVIIIFVTAFIDNAMGTVNPGVGIGYLGGAYALAVMIPGIAVAVRRLHDTNRTGWWLLIGFIPLVGAIILIVFLATDGAPGENQYGANPKESPGAGEES